MSTDVTDLLAAYLCRTQELNEKLEANFNCSTLGPVVRNRSVSVIGATTFFRVRVAIASLFIRLPDVLSGFINKELNLK